MRFHRFRQILSQSPGQRMIREHSRWLTRALRRHRAVPRIPVRKVAEGGFAHLAATPRGRAVADSWWYRALRQIE